MWRAILVGALVLAVSCGPKNKKEANEPAEGCLDPVEQGDFTPSTVELFDAHGHIMPAWNDEVVPTAVKAGGLSGYVMLGVGDTLTLQNSDPKTYVGCAWTTVYDDLDSDDAKKDMGVLTKALDAGAKCIGEISIRHFASGPEASAKEFSATNAFLIKLYKEAETNGVPINVHFDYSAEHISDLKAALDQAKGTTFIWAHMGDAPPSVIDEMLKAHPNLNVDISSRNPLCDYTPRLVSLEDQRLDDGSLKIKAEWTQVFEDHSDRVLFGTDLGPGNRHKKVEDVVLYFRVLLGQLSETAQKRIGHENARKLFGVQ